MCLLQKVHDLNNLMPKHRTTQIVALKAGEELGELNEAILVRDGHKPNKKYEDMEGVTGEAIDLALCALSIALKESSLSEVSELIGKKLASWEAKMAVK